MWFGRSIADRSGGVDCIPLYAVKFFKLILDFVR